MESILADKADKVFHSLSSQNTTFLGENDLHHIKVMKGQGESKGVFSCPHFLEKSNTFTCPSNARRENSSVSASASHLQPVSIHRIHSQCIRPHGNEEHGFALRSSWCDCGSGPLWLHKETANSSKLLLLVSSAFPCLCQHWNGKQICPWLNST